MKLFIVDSTAKGWNVPIVNGQPKIPDDAPKDVKARVEEATLWKESMKVKSAPKPDFVGPPPPSKVEG